MAITKNAVHLLVAEAAASAWTRDVVRAQRAAREPEAGTVWSMYALEEYTAVEHAVSSR